MSIRAQLFDGSILQFPDGTDPEVVDRVVKQETQARRSSEQSAYAPPPSTQRTAGEAFTDIGAGLIGGLGGLLKVPGQVAKLVPGLYDVGEVIEKPGEYLSELGNKFKSEGLKVREQLRSKAISEAEKEGILSEFVTAIGQTIKDPALLSTFIAEQLPQLLGPAGAVKATKLLTSGKVAAGAAAEAAGTAGALEAAQAAAAKTASRAAIGTGAVMQGADIGSDTFDAAMKLLKEQQPNLSEEERRDIALNKARQAALGAGVVSLGTMLIPGAKAIEERLAGLPGKGRVRSALGEAAQEAVEEGGGAFAKNVGLVQIDPTQSLTAGVGAAAGLGALGGGTLGAVLGRAPKVELLEGQQPGETLPQFATRLAREIQAGTIPEETLEQKSDVLNIPQLVTLFSTEGYAGVEKYKQTLLEMEQTPEIKAAVQDATKLQQQATIEHLQRTAPSKKTYEESLLGGESPIMDSTQLVELAQTGGPQALDQYIASLAPLPVTNEIKQSIKDAQDLKQRLTVEQIQRIAPPSQPLSATLAVGQTIPDQNQVLNLVQQELARKQQEAAQPKFDQAADTAVKQSMIDPAATLDAEAIRQIGFAPSKSPNSIFQQLIGKNVTDPVQVKQIAESLQKIQSNPVTHPITQGKIADFLERLQQLQPPPSVEQVAEEAQNVDTTVQPPVGTSVPVAGQPSVGAATEGIAGTQPAGVGVPEQAAGATAAGAGAQPPSLTKPAKPKAPKAPKAPKPSLRTNIYAELAQTRKAMQEAGASEQEISAALAEKRAAFKAQQATTEPAPGVAPITTEPAPVEKFSPEVKQKIGQLGTALEKIMAGYGLKGVGLNLVDGLSSEGEYANKLIKIALDMDNPVRVLRHETVHGMKELGFFSPNQWAALERMARDKWVDKYLKSVTTTHNGQEMSRYDAYMDLYGNEQAVLEEAIADAFGDFDVNKAPPGLLSSLLNRMKQFFAGVKSAFNGQGFDTAESVFRKIEEGKLKASKEAAPDEGAKPSLREPVIFATDRFTANDRGEYGIDIRNPVTLKDGTRLDGFSDKAQTTFTGYDKSGERITIRRNAVNPDDIVFSKDSNKTAEALKKALQQVDKSAAKPYYGAGVRTIAEGAEDEDLRTGQPAVRPSIRGGQAAEQGREAGAGRERGVGRTEAGEVPTPKRAVQVSEEELKPLPGAPSVPGFHGPDPRLVEVAKQYAQDKGIDLKRQREYVVVDPERAARIAQAYEEMPHAPQDPKVKEAYRDLIRQTTDQYQALADAGYKFWFLDMSREDNQDYASTPWNAMRDIRANKEMGVFPTSEGFGTSEEFDPSTNPLLEDTGIRWPFGSVDGELKPVLANDLFRAVHDAFGHGLEGAGFRAQGEENAWQAHARLFTGPALGALTSETRGQNSWLNYGPHGETNRTAKVEDTVFADQKTGLMPEWTWQEGKAKDALQGVVLGEKQPAASSFVGTHYGNARVARLSGSKYGTGIRGAERRRLENSDDDRIKKRVYFYVPKQDGSMPIPEAGLGQYVYKQKFDNILGPGKEMSRLFSEANGDSNFFESAVVDAGYDGYAVPSMGMMVVLNHDTPVEYQGTRVELAAKPSLRSVPLSTRDLMEGDQTYAQASLGLDQKPVYQVYDPKTGEQVSVHAKKTDAEKKAKQNNLAVKQIYQTDVRRIAIALNEDTLTKRGKMNRKAHTPENLDDIARAMADEIGYQLQATAKTGTGLGWYSNNYPKAINELGKRFPELKTNPHARHVFTALVAVTSNGEKVAKNIDNAIELYTKLRDGKPLVAMGNRRKTALVNNLVQIEELLKKFGTDFQKELLREITVADMNAYLRSIGEKPDGSYLANTVIPAAAIYFGPKLGAFYANLSGSEGYLTMDLWWSRTFNRMRGLLIPNATDASINKFKELADNPSLSREDVLQEIIPLRNKYEEYGFFTELEELVKAKEPATSAKKPAWLLKARRAAGPAFDQLMLEHQLEKMANTIYKNEYEMLEEAPFGANDRKFMYDAARRAQAYLKRDGIDLTLADIQAALWYYEKRLYQKLSGRKADDIGYEEAILAQANKGTGPARPSVVFAGGANAGNVPARTGAVPDQTGAATAQPAKPSLRAPQTEAFKRWFGNSKIVDADGNPKVMYHGTGKDYKIFTTERRQAKAIFVTDDPEFAEKFAKDTFARAADEAAKGVGISDAEYKEGVKRAIAAIRKDYKSRPEGMKMIAGVKAGYDNANAEAQEYMREAFKETVPTGPNIMPVYVRAENPFDFENEEHIQKIEPIFIRNENGSLPKTAIKNGLWSNIESEGVQKAIKEAGFDGFYVNEHGVKNLAVYSSNQIKSATGNIGTFDITNPDIRYSLRSTLPADVARRIDQTTTGRDQSTFVERITDAIGPKNFSYFRQQALNRYEGMSAGVRRLAEKMGGEAFLADISAEAAALESDRAAGVTASVMGVHDRVGGVPVYKKQFYVIRDMNGVKTIMPQRFNTQAQAAAVAAKVKGEVRESGYTTVSNLNGKVEGLLKIFSPLAKYNDPYIYQAYQFWAGVKRGSKYVQNASGQYQEKLFNDPKDIAHAAALEKQYPEFVDIQKKYIAFNNELVKYMVDTGVITPAAGKEFVKHADYIPFYRQLDGEETVGPRVFQSIAGAKPPKKAKGGEAQLADFLENIVRNTQSSIQAGMKNVAAQKAVNMAMDLGEASKLTAVSSAPNVVTVLEGGKQVSYSVQDQLLINSMKSLNLPDMPFIGLLAGPANLLRNLVTKDPGFMLANLMRDSLATWTLSGTKMVPIVDTLKNYATAISGKSPEYQALLNAGVLGGYDYAQGVEVSAKNLERELRKEAKVRATGIKGYAELASTPFTSLWNTLEKGTQASDAATRIEVYKKTLAETGNEAEALHRSYEVMNFNRKGASATVRILTAAVPFLNARMQGLDVFYRAATGQIANKDAAAIQKTFFIRAATMVALSCMYWTLTHDDDDYKKQEQETKDNNWLIPSLGVKIPIPFEVGVLFKVIPERIMALTFGKDTTKDFASSMKRQLESTLMFTAIPQVALPYYEVATNHSFFTDRPVIGQGMENVAPEYQVGPSTSLVAQAIGKSVGYSPMKVDHLIKGYTGTMGMYLSDLVDAVYSTHADSPKASKRFEQLPVIKRFAVDPEARGNVTDFYQLKDAVDQATRTINFLERTSDFKEMGKYMKDNSRMLAMHDYVLDLEKTMKQLRDSRVMINSSKMDKDAKRDALMRINHAEQAITKNIQQIKAFAQ